MNINVDYKRVKEFRRLLSQDIKQSEGYTAWTIFHDILIELQLMNLINSGISGFTDKEKIDITNYGKRKSNTK